MPYNHNDASTKRGNGIKIGAEYYRSFVHKQITEHSTADPRHHSHNRSHHGIESGTQRLLRTSDGKQCQASILGCQKKVTNPASTQIAK